MTLKEIIDAILLESGVGTEASYATNSEDAHKRMLYLVNRSSTVLSRYEWQALRSTHEFTLSTDTSYPLPDDYKAFIPDTFYTENRLWNVNFPASASEWAYLQATSGGNGVRVRARLIGDTIRIYEPDSGETLRFEYLTKYPVLATDGTTKKARFTADDDTFILDDELLIMDTIWRYKKLVGLEDWREDLAASKLYERRLKGQESGAQTITPSEDWGSTPYYELWRPT